MKVQRRGEHIGLLVSKWGNSLAMRLPAACAKQLGVAEGDTLIGEMAADDRLILSAEGRAIDKAQARRMREFIAKQEETAPVVAGMRRRARY